MDKWILPLVVLAVLALALAHRVNAYQSFVNGVKEGLDLFVSVYPAMLAMLLMVNVLDMSTLMERASAFFSSLFPAVPASVWPMVFFRPISGNASLAILHSIFTKDGPDSLAGFIGSILQGATDTTFYVIALYFGSVGVRKIKSALGIGLIADAVGMITAIVLGLMFYGG